MGSKFNKTIPLHLLDDFLSQKCGKEMLFRRALYPNLVWQGHSEWQPHSSERGKTVVGDQSVRSGAHLAVARIRTVGPTLRAEPTSVSFRRSATRRRVRSWPATGSGLSRQSLATSLL